MLMKGMIVDQTHLDKGGVIVNHGTLQGHQVEEEKEETFLS